MNSEKYGMILNLQKKNLTKASQSPHLSWVAILQYDNAIPYQSKTSPAKITVSGLFVFFHSTYSLDLAPSDLYFFPKLKQFLEGKWFVNKEELKGMVLKWFRTADRQFYMGGMNKCFHVTKNRSIGMAIMWKNKDYRTLFWKSFGNFWWCSFDFCYIPRMKKPNLLTNRDHRCIY